MYTNTISIFKTLFTALVLVAFGTSCDDDNGTGSDGGNIPSENGVVATIDGDSWESNGSNGFRNTTTVDDQDVVELEAMGAIDPETGVAEDNEVVSVTILGEKGSSSISTQTYQVGDGYPSAQISFTKKVDGEQTLYVAESGEVTVSNVSEDGFSGSFSGNVVSQDNSSDTKSIEEGGFKVNFLTY